MRQHKEGLLVPLVIKVQKKNLTNVSLSLEFSYLILYGTSRSREYSKYQFGGIMKTLIRSGVIFVFLFALGFSDLASSYTPKMLTWMFGEIKPNTMGGLFFGSLFLCALLSPILESMHNEIRDA
jgi:hypothetical protein